MNKSTAHLSFLLAGLLVTSSVYAQSTSASGSSDLPPKAGEASTQTNGVPNAATTNSPVTEAPITSKEAVRQDAHSMGAAAATELVPGRAGEESTMVRGVPNMDPLQPRALSRAEVRNELLGRRAAFEAQRKLHAMGDFAAPADTATH
jgi:hypothetical protein